MRISIEAKQWKKEAILWREVENDTIIYQCFLPLLHQLNVRPSHDSDLGISWTSSSIRARSF